MSSYYLNELAAIVLYFAGLLVIGFMSYRRNQTAADFIIGGRSMNYWLTALAAHASDMSSWIFMGFPATILAKGLFGAWTAVGLIVFMFLNWQMIAPRIRIATEQFNSMTLSSYFESRLADTSGMIRVFSALMSVVFYTIYISAGLVGLGLLIETLFNIPYSYGILIGIILVVPYVFMGGYKTLAWIDLFQGMFLMCVIIFVPLFVLPSIGGFQGISQALSAKQLSHSLFPNFSAVTLLDIIFLTVGWGLGYFGQPHILTKFMGIRNVHEIVKSKYIGMTWMVISLSAATFVGLVGVAYFADRSLADPEQVFTTMVKDVFPPFIVGLFLCAVLAATINAMSSYVLVLASNVAEDFYKRIFRKEASSRELLLVSRLGVIFSAMLAFVIAYQKTGTIYSLVLYAWSGLGSSFGPLMLFSLYSKKVNKFGAWAGILVGGVVSGVWPYFNESLSLSIPPMIPGFLCSSICIPLVSALTRHKIHLAREK